MVQDDTDLNEVKQQQTYYLDNDEAYPMSTYEGQPEFELFNRDNFNVSRDEDLPTVTFMSNTNLNELAP